MQLGVREPPNTVQGPWKQFFVTGTSPFEASKGRTAIARARQAMDACSFAAAELGAGAGAGVAMGAALGTALGAAMGAAMGAAPVRLRGPPSVAKPPALQRKRNLSWKQAAARLKSHASVRGPGKQG